MQKTEKIWFDGKLIPWDQAHVHVLTHSLHYGLAVFEGIRCYQCTDGRSAVFRLREHIARLFDSAKIVKMKIPYSASQLELAVVETLRVNKLKEGYIRPIAFIGAGEMGLYAVHNPIQVVIAAYPWGSYLGDEGIKNGIRVKISSFLRCQASQELSRAKLTGSYVASIMAKLDALETGYQEAIMLSPDGNISEASGENLFIVKGNVLKTPPLTSPLPGITRDAIIQFAKEMKIAFKEKDFKPKELLGSDEVFLTGTAAEITPIREIDGKKIAVGKPGPITQALQKKFFATVKGEEPRYTSWLTYL
ncbi:MAG: branched-chain amino acid transaminase [Deltaproteobacteria bacterium]|nr:branched-chain amino acid transaminase [Deltaproteobacteria bacterium]